MIQTLVSEEMSGSTQLWHQHIGHLKKEYWKIQESKKDDSKSEEYSVKSNLGMINEVLSICSVSEYNEEWLLDSGASHHICPHKDCFASYQTISDGIVFWDISIHVRLLGLEVLKLKCLIEL